MNNFSRSVRFLAKFNVYSRGYLIFKTTNIPFSCVTHMWTSLAQSCWILLALSWEHCFPLSYLSKCSKPGCFSLRYSCEHGFVWVSDDYVTGVKELRKRRHNASKGHAVLHFTQCCDQWLNFIVPFPPNIPNIHSVLPTNMLDMSSIAVC